MRIRAGWGATVRVFLVLAFWTAGSMYGEIYRYVDEKGVVHLANRPDGGIAPITPERATAYRRVSSRPPVYSSAAGGYSGYDELIHQAANRHSLDFNLIKAVIQAESSFNPRAVSRKGAQGLMQLMPSTARGLGVRNVFDPRENIMAGANYLRQMMDRYNNNLKLSLAAYNAGPSSVDRWGGVPPFPETRDYIFRVVNYLGRYTRTLSSEGKLFWVVKNGTPMLTNRPLP